MPGGPIRPSAFEIADLNTRTVYEATNLPMGRCFSPVVFRGNTAQLTIAFINTGGDILTGNGVATPHTGIWARETTLPTESNSSSVIEVKGARKISTAIDPSDEKLKLMDLAQGADECGHYVEEELAKGYSTDELAFSHTSQGAAFVNFLHVYYAHNINASTASWSKSGKASLGLTGLGLDGGHGDVFRGDRTVIGRLLRYLSCLQVLTLHTVPVFHLSTRLNAIQKDTTIFGIVCVRNLLYATEIVVYDESEISRLRWEAKVHATSANREVVTFINATILTIENVELSADLTAGGT
ncbi:hypothetical protein BKA82DRAFT_26612 [Pisolithus tinctorius]|uniref:Uncharacterized protein n=1 Tax=Pisolithus tinctorius Marx 270 TaxID=870435 RepID=A0A0C3J4J0_PISTI|nr:hypothetical protein BKA82DRAFT_26612 [Pisolithus tinctorius]KIO03993.1 hypothetical protein M404DRAFT_26612 [Pisolithus tinctorius Marx 270]